MTIEPGTSLLHYRLVEKIGEGGMGVVWKAVDTTLDREVAIKVLPPNLATDPERLARFEREARLLASLNHPHIASVFGLHEVRGLRFLAMEYVSGENLAQRLRRGPLLLEDAIAYARQIATAVETAHEAGVVHRDLKPANIVLAAGDTVKVLDFGLAKALDAGGGSSPRDPAHSPTVTSAGTLAGVILGTAAYMAPEQAKGRSVDRRADIWAFGAVLWEMLTGTPLFRGETISETLAAVLRDEIDWSALPAATPRFVSALLRRCLDRDPSTRLQAIGEARVALGRPGEADSALAATATPAARRGVRLAWWLPLPALGLGVLFGLWLSSPAGDSPRLLRAELLPPAGAEYEFEDRQPGPVSVSPDGSRIVFAARDENREVALWVRTLDEEQARPLSGTEAASYPFWSPDGRSIGFFAEGKLRRIDTTGGPVLTICDAPFGKSGSWNADNVIVFAPSYNTGIYRVSADGGSPEPLTELSSEQSENSHRFPIFLPDGKRFLFLARRTGPGATDDNAILVSSLDGGEPRFLMNAPTDVALSAGHLLYLRDRVLLARRFDASRLEFTGDPYPLTEGVRILSGAAKAVFSASANGVLVYDRGDDIGERLTWLDFKGNRLEELGEPATFYTPSISPDGTRVAVTRAEAGGKEDVWVYDSGRGAATRVTSGASNSRDAIWMPDGKRLVYRTRTGEALDLFLISAEGVGKPKLLLADKYDKQPCSVSRDGSWLLYQTTPGKTGFDLYALPLDGEVAGDPVPYLDGPYDEFGGKFAPDGHWVAYESNESGRSEIYVASFPEPEIVRRVSTNGGRTARWAPDGSRLVYVTPEGVIYAAEVRFDGGGLSIGTPEVMFDLFHPVYEDYDITSDRVLLSERESRGAASPLTLVLNWAATRSR